MVDYTKIIIDTNIAIKLLNGDTKVSSELVKYKILFLPIIVCGELLYGAINSSRSEQNLEILNDFISRCEILKVDALVANEYAKIRLALKLKGRPIPENDIWIAAIAQVNNLGIITLDKHFNYIEELDVKAY